MIFKKKVLFFAFFIFCILFLMPFVYADIVITEVMYKSNINSNCRYIELYNNGSYAVDLSDWKTQDRAGATWKNFDDITISPGEYIVIAHKLTGWDSYESFYGNNNGVWDSNDGDYNAVDGYINFDYSDDIASIKDIIGTVWSSFSYGPSYGANGDGDSLHLLKNSSIAAGTPTQGATCGISCCGDGTCDADEACDGCPTDCGICPYCGDGTCDANESCSNCSADCGICSYCGDGVCDANESCSNCSADCLSEGQVCCNSIAHTGDCCVNANCSENEICQNYNCIKVNYCGDGNCSTNESCSNCSADCACSSSQCCSSNSTNADSRCCVDSGAITTSGNVCCGGTEYTGECCTDAECSSPNICNTSNHACITPYTNECTAESCLCDLSISILSASIFNISVPQNYYIYTTDLFGNYTGSTTATYWIENSSGYVSSYAPTNITISTDENNSRSYTPFQRCGNETQYIKAKIVAFGCNDSGTSNDESDKTIIIWGEDPTICANTTEITEEAATDETAEPEVTEEEQAEGEGAEEAKEGEISGEEQEVEQGGTKETVEETEESAYRTKSKKIKKIATIFFISLLLGTAVFFGIQNKEQIIKFIEEKKKGFLRKKKWKEYLEKRRGKGVMQRLSKGFLKKQKNDGR